MQVAVVGLQFGALLPVAFVGKAVAGDLLVLRMLLLVDGNILAYIGRHIFQLLDLIVPLAGQVALVPQFSCFVRSSTVNFLNIRYSIE